MTETLIMKEEKHMNDLAITVQKVINTIQGIEIRATEENLDRMLACIKTLGSVRDRMFAMNAEMERQNANAEPEEENLPEMEVQEIEPAQQDEEA